MIPLVAEQARRSWNEVVAGPPLAVTSVTRSALTKIQLLSRGDGFRCCGDGILQLGRVGIGLRGDACEPADAQTDENEERAYCFSSQDIALAGSPKTFAVTPSFAYFSVSRCIAI